MPKKEPSKTRVVVLVQEPSGNTVRVESTQTSKASAIITALDRTFAAYSDDIEAETRGWLDIADGLFSAFRHAFKLPSAKAVMSRHHREVQLDERASALDQRELVVIQRDHDVSTRETIAEENRRALDTRADLLDKRASEPVVITGESVTLLPDGSAEVKVIVGTNLHTYREVTVLGPNGELVTSTHDLPGTLTRIMNFYGVDTVTNLPDHVLAAKILEHVGRLREMNAEIQDTGDRLTTDPELEEHADDSDGPTVIDGETKDQRNARRDAERASDDAEPTVGTAPLGGEAVKELIRKRDRNLAGT